MPGLRRKRKPAEPAPKPEPFARSRIHPAGPYTTGCGRLPFLSIQKVAYATASMALTRIRHRASLLPKLSQQNEIAYECHPLFRPLRQRKVVALAE